MRVNLSQMPSFKGIYTFQIPKDSFENPDNINECADAFTDEINRVLNTYGGFFKVLAAKFAPKLFEIPRCRIFFESPGYEQIMSEMKDSDFKDYSLGWLEANSGTRLSRPINENCHSFYVFTADDADNIGKMFSGANCVKMRKRAKEESRKSESYEVNEIRKSAKYSEILDDNFYAYLQGKPIVNYKIKQSLAGLEKAIKSIDLNA